MKFMTTITTIEKTQIVFIKNNALNHLTINRLNSAISKVGEFKSNKEEVYDFFSDDILLEINGFHIYGLKEWILEQIKVKFG